jgi:hypothetical protein
VIVLLAKWNVSRSETRAYMCSCSRTIRGPRLAAVLATCHSSSHLSRCARCVILRVSFALASAHSAEDFLLASEMTLMPFLIRGGGACSRHHGGALDLRSTDYVYNRTSRVFHFVACSEASTIVLAGCLLIELVVIVHGTVVP